MFNCSVVLGGSVGLFGGRPAVVCGGEVWSYGRLYGLVCGVANGLVRAGVGRGDRVVLVCPNRVEFVAVYFGVLMVGGVVVPLNVRLRRRELGAVLLDTGAVGMFCFVGGEGWGLLEEGLGAFEGAGLCQRFWVVGCGGGGLGRLGGFGVEGVSSFEGLVEGEGSSFLCVGTEGSDAAVVLYSSGTVGEAKGVVLSHWGVFAAAVGGGRLVGMGCEDVLLVGLPLFHCFAQSFQMNAGFLCGGCLVLLECFEAGRALGLMEEFGVSLFCGVPTMYWGFLHCDGLGRFDLGRIGERFRWGCCGGAALGGEVLREVEGVFGFRILEGYGLSETGGLGASNVGFLERKVGSVGLPVLGMSVRVVDEGMVGVGVGECGEVVVRGPSVMLGYFNRPEWTDEVFRGGWLHTGDVGRLDGEGYLYIVDRVKDVIIRGGFNVFPGEVEVVLCGHPAVSMAAVVGVPDEKYGEEVVAFVVLREGVSVSGEAIVGWARGELAGYKYPREVRVVDGLPLGSTGKVLRREVRARWLKGGG